MTIEEAVKSACGQPKLSSALAWIAIWETDRVVKQALANLSNPAVNTNQPYDTCFEFLFEKVIDAYDAH
jgi:hypothetical protein